jgi:dnd system-associated protein 4
MPETAGERGVERDRVSIDPQVHELYRSLTEGNDIEAAPFRTMKDVFMLAACLGFQRGERRKLSRRQQVFRWEQFSQQTDVPVLKALAIADAKDIKVLLRLDQILTVAEEYANSGIHDLRTTVVDPDGQPLWNLVNLIRQGSAGRRRQTAAEKSDEALPSR